jgi:hypothetical protein
MTVILPSGERQRLFGALSVLAFIGAVAFVVAVLFSMVSIKPAHAEVLALPGSNSGWSACNRYGVCQWGEGSVPGGPHIITVPQPTSQADIEEQDRLVKKWKDECGVKIVRGQYGVMRYTYAKKGCEFGSPE